MPEYLSPGVYVEEISTGPRPIEGVSTSTAGFVGRTERGPTAPRLVTSFLDYQRWFGAFIEPERSFLPYAIQGFFQNGGKRAFIARVVDEEADTAVRNLAAPLSDTGTGRTSILVAEARGPGDWGNRLLVRVAPGTQADLGTSPPRDLFRLTFLYYKDGIPAPFVDPTNPANLSSPFYVEPTVSEEFDNLSAVEGSSNYIVTTVNAGSRLVRLTGWSNTNNNPNSLRGPARLLDVGFGVTATTELATGNEATTLLLSAKGPGAWGNALGVSVTAAGDAVDLRIDWNDFNEEFTGLSADPKNPKYLTDFLNANSRLVQAAWQSEGDDEPTPSLPNPTPEGDPQSLEGGEDTPFAGGGEAQDLRPGDFAGDGTKPANERTGLAGLEAIDEVSILVVPDEVNPAQDNGFQITNHVLDQCERLKDRFAVLSVDKNRGNVATIFPVRDTTFGAIYYPWIRVFDPRTQDTLLIPPTGHVAGIYARTDIERGVHKAPGNEVVRGILTRDIDANTGPLEYRISKGEHDILNPRGINVIRDFRSDRRGIRVWGARTMSSNAEWKYINVRRLFLFIEESIDEGTQWVVFEPNSEPTWARVVRSVSNFLVRVWRDGALFGATQEEAFFVKCDRSTMTQDDIDNGRLICYIGVAPVKPAEFVIFRISQKTIEATQ